MTQNRKQALIDEVIELFKKSYSDSYVETFLKTKKVPVEDIPLLMTEAEQKFFKDSIGSTKGVLQLHLERYNKNIDSLEQVEEIPYNDTLPSVDEVGNIVEAKITYQHWRNSRNRKISAMDELIDTMVQKENLVALVNRDKHIELIEDISVNIQKPKRTDYDLDLLSVDELSELYQLMKKARGGNEQPPGVTYAPIEDAQIVGEETKTELPANIESIQHEKQTTAPTPATGNSKLQLELKKLAARKLRDAGANLDDEERKLLDES